MSPPGPPDGWQELASAVTSPPEDPLEWVSWARMALSRIGCYQLAHPEMPPAFMLALAEFRGSLKAAMGARNEDLIADTLRLIREDVEELDDAGPEVKPLAARKHRRDR
jgi:hypothetical protein